MHIYLLNLIHIYRANHATELCDILFLMKFCVDLKLIY